MDEEFQWVLDVLKKRELEDNTIVIFMGDNGMAFPHGKGSLYDPGLRVPMIVRWPGVIKPGTSTDALISGEDLAPTLLEAAAVPAPKGMRGIRDKAAVSLRKSRLFMISPLLPAYPYIEHNRHYKCKVKLYRRQESRDCKVRRLMIYFGCLA